MRNTLTAICGALCLIAAPLALAQQAPPSSTPAAQQQPQDTTHCKPAPSSDTKVAPRKGACFSNMGSSFDDEELNQTGASNPGEALRLSDPSVSYHR
jgi:hypothetical protein